MSVLFRDVETRSTLHLADVGAWRYAAEPATEVLCIAYAVDDAAVQIWTPSEPIPEAFITAAADPDWLVVAHHDAFETAIETRLLGPRYGWPQTPIARHRCTMAAALANALPGALDGAAAALGLPVRKDADGHRTMMQMAKPRLARCGEDPDVIHWHDDLERRLRLQAYCKRDVEVERELYKRLPPLSADEQQLWQLDAAINARGFFVDLELARAAQTIVLAEQAAIDVEVAELTGGEITSVNQVARLTTYLKERGHNATGMTKRAVAAMLAAQPAADVRRLLELRQQGAQAAARKLDSLVVGIDDDHRLRGTLRFHGASTGRWAGTRFQPQNLKKPQAKNLDAAVDAVRAGDLQRVRTFGAPLAIIGDISRNMIRATPGCVLYGADFSAVESRVLAWLADEKWKLGTYQRFDETGDPALEPYCVTATRILRRTVTPEDEAGRTIGKTCDLAFGFGGGLGAWRRFDRSATYNDGQVESFKTQWRTQHAATVRFWYALEGALRRAVRTGQRVSFNNLAAEIIAGTLYLTLPSGRRLSYPEARLEPGKYDTPQIVFKDNARGGWADVRGWYGTFTENVVQAVARDLLAAALVRLEATGYPVALHCHDEAVCEAPEHFGDLATFLGIMIALPDWAAGLPLAAKAWKRTNYAKPQAPPQTPTPIDSPKPASISMPKPVMKTETVGTVTLNGWHAPPKPTPAAIVAPAKQYAPGPWAHIPLADVIGQPLRDGKLICPFHADATPSLHIYPGHFHCFGCGVRGDHLDWLMMIEGMTRDAALRMLATWDGPRAKLQPADADEKARHMTAAMRIWDEARPITNTLAMRYLRDVRKIDVDLLPTDDAALRFHPRCPFGPGVWVPCLIALYRDVWIDTPAGIHRVALTDDVFAGAKVKRRTLGSWPDARAIKLWPATDTLFLAEGIETTLAAATRLQHCDKPMRPAWAAGNAVNIAKFPVLPEVLHLTVLADHDEAGEKSADDCYVRWYAAGRKIMRLRPKPAGADFNDLILERRAP